MLTREFRYPGNVGVLLALIFLLNELVLIPLFEISRDRLTIAAVRWRLAAGESVSLRRRRSLWLTLGLSDGVRIPLRSVLLPRSLKLFTRLSLLISYFIFEFHVDQRLISTPHQYRFTALGLGNRPGMSSVITAFPIEGISATALRGLIPLDSSLADADRNYSVYHAPWVSLHYNEWCARTQPRGESIRRRLFFGVYTSVGPSQPGLIVCLNKSQGRDGEELLSYNVERTRTAVGKASAVTLHREVARNQMNRMYEASVTVRSGPLAGIHDGFVVLTFNSHFVKDIRVAMYGLVLIRSRETIARVSIPLTIREIPCCRLNATDCLSGNRNWLGTWTFVASKSTCPNGLTYDIGSVRVPPKDVQDIDLRLSASERFCVGAPHDVMRAWLAETQFSELQASSHFTHDIEEKMLSAKVFFSTATSRNMTLVVGAPRSHVTMNAKSTIALITVLVVFVFYCTMAFGIEWYSRLATRIGSDCISREAVIGMLFEDAMRKGLIDNKDGRHIPLKTTELDSGDLNVTVALNTKFDFGYRIDG